MKFYNRETELNLLAGMAKRSSAGAKMTVIYGRRRIGKTSLALASVEGRFYVYLFTGRKSEVLLCQDFKQEIEQSLGKELLGEFRRFRDLFAWLMEYAVEHPLTVIIDEFQEFLTVNPAVFGDMQELWDRRKHKSRMHLILSGSVYRLMKRIFEDAHEPLFGRANERIHLQSLSNDVLATIMRDYHPQFNNMDLLCLYGITGGIPKYLELLADKGAMSVQAMRDEIFRPGSFWLDEGRNLLIGEFGKNHTIYFSILSLLATGKTGRTEMESILGRNIGGYLGRLANEYGLIGIVRPIGSKPGGKIQKYEITDPFLRFWFRFIYKYSSSSESGNFRYLASVFDRDFSTWAGKDLENWFMEKFRLTGTFSRLGRYWDRKGNEIDLVAIDEQNGTVHFAEVKFNTRKANPEVLRRKAAPLLEKMKNYTPSFAIYGPDDMLRQPEDLLKSEKGH